MKTPEEFLDEASFNHVVVNSFSFALHSFSREGEYQSTIEKITKKAMIAFAAYCCERQRESDAEKAKTKDEKLITGQVWPMFYTKTVVDKSSILNNKLITDDYDN